MQQKHQRKGGKGKRLSAARTVPSLNRRIKGGHSEWNLKGPGNEGQVTISEGLEKENRSLPLGHNVFLRHLVRVEEYIGGKRESNLPPGGRGAAVLGEEPRGEKKEGFIIRLEKTSISLLQKEEAINQ